MPLRINRICMAMTALALVHEGSDAGSCELRSNQSPSANMRSQIDERTTRSETMLYIWMPRSRIPGQVLDNTLDHRAQRLTTLPHRVNDDDEGCDEEPADDDAAPCRESSV